MSKTQKKDILMRLAGGIANVNIAFNDEDQTYDLVKMMDALEEIEDAVNWAKRVIIQNLYDAQN